MIRYDVTDMNYKAANNTKRNHLHFPLTRPVQTPYALPVN